MSGEARLSTIRRARSLNFAAPSLGSRFSTLKVANESSPVPAASTVSRARSAGTLLKADVVSSLKFAKE